MEHVRARAAQGAGRSSGRAPTSFEYLRISVEVSESEPNVTMSPAACHVVPDVT